MSLKILFVCLLFTGITLAGCVNKDDPTAEKANASWVFAGLNYTSLTNSSAGTNVHFMQSTADGIWGLFNKLPNASVTSYKIKKGPAASLADNEMVFQVDHGANETWYSTGEGNNYATVSKGYYGEIKITVPPVAVRHFSSGVMQNDSTIASCEFNY